MKDLEARKRALVAESEIYRQTMRLELQNLKLHALRTRRRFDWFTSASPLFALAPLMGKLFGARLQKQDKKKKRRKGIMGLLGTALTVWRLYRKAKPVMQGFSNSFFPNHRRETVRPEEQSPAANI